MKPMNPYEGLCIPISKSYMGKSILSQIINVRELDEVEQFDKFMDKATNPEEPEIENKDTVVINRKEI